MNTQIILQVSRGTLEGTMPFSEVVDALFAAGVECYRVDYASRRKTFYGPDGDVASTAIDYEDLPPIAADFCLAAVRAAIADSQHQGQKYRDFTRRVMEAGVQSYVVFLRGRRVTYWGRVGDQHTEWFPGAAPADDSQPGTSK